MKDKINAEVCVVGGSGFIGTCLSKRLDRDPAIRFTIIDKNISDTFPDKTAIADIRDLSKIEDYVPKSAVIINLAAEHRDDVRPEALYDEVNVVGADNICSVATKHNVKTIIFTSSVAVYGFAPVGVSETGEIAPFNAYGRTKYEAEQVYRAWQEEEPDNRTLVIVRPTVVFGEENRGNVYNLLRQLVKGWFVMVGDGENKKSMAYVENVAAFLEHVLFFPPGIHIYNYVDKPDYNMNDLVATIRRSLGRNEKVSVRLPYGLAYAVGFCCDILAVVTRKSFAVSRIRIQKFCSNSEFNTSAEGTGFVAPVTLTEGLERTIKKEFLSSGDKEN